MLHAHTVLLALKFAGILTGRREVAFGLLANSVMFATRKLGTRHVVIGLMPATNVRTDYLLFCLLLSMLLCGTLSFGVTRIESFFLMA